MKTKLHLILLVTLSLVWLILSRDAAASDWFVRPAGGNYGTENGTSYENAWDGLSNVVWGVGGVEAGDNLYVCGLHLFPYTAYSSLTTMVTIAASGTADARITIRGDYPGDQGIIWGGHIMGGELNPEWTDEGDNTYSTTSGNTSGYFYFEDVTATSWTLLTKVDSLQECKATPGSYYSATFTYGDPIYVHCSDNGDPTDRIVAPVKGWNLYLTDQQYITFKDIEFYLPMFAGIGSYIRWEGCKLWYIPYGLRLWDNTHHLEFIDCDRAYGVGGFSFQDKKPRGEDAPHDMTIRGCKIHDIGIYRQNSDAEGIGTNGVDDLTIENNEFYNCGSAFTSYPYPGSTNRNIIIRWNYIHDMHQLGGARGAGIEIGMDPPNEEDLSGNQIYGNIVANCPGKGYKSNYDLHKVVFYNNVAYSCYDSFYFNAVYRENNGPKIELKNNISISPTRFHLYFGSATGEDNYTIDSDYNIWYPDTGNLFEFKELGWSTVTDFSGWQALSKSGCTFDPHSIAANPLFVDPENGDFHLSANSPAIDAGINVGLTWDFEGIPVPQGNAPDIGAYEYTLLPVAVIQNEPKQGYAPLTVSFDGSQSTSPHGDIVSYEWDLGDGSTSTGIKTSHIFTSPGEYTVTLTVTDDQGLKGKSQINIIVFEKEFRELPAGCYNNVFNPAKGERALIVVELPKQAHVKLSLYNTRGNKIRELADEQKEAGTHKYYWNGKNDSGNMIGSGLYFVHIQAGDYKKTKKIVVIK